MVPIKVKLKILRYGDKMEILPVPLYDTWMGFQISVEKLVDKPFTNIYEYLSIYFTILLLYMLSSVKYKFSSKLCVFTVQ